MYTTVGSNQVSVLVVEDSVRPLLDAARQENTPGQLESDTACLMATKNDTAPVISRTGRVSRTSATSLEPVRAAWRTIRRFFAATQDS